jgi:hypothetical protein
MAYIVAGILVVFPTAGATEVATTIKPLLFPRFLRRGPVECEHIQHAAFVRIFS